MFARMRDAVETPRGLLVQEHWILLAKAPAGTDVKVVDLGQFASR